MGEISGKEITVSFDWEVTGTTTSGSFYIQLNNTPWTSFSNTVSVSASNKKGKAVKTFVMPTTSTTSTVMCRKDSLVGTLTISNFKIELGNKATDWTPAPEDVQVSIDLKASKTDVYSKSEVYTKSQTDSAINVAKDSINLGVSNTYETKKNVETKISTASSSTLSSAKSYADTKKTEAISTASTDATNKVNSAKTELNTAINKKANSTDVYTKSETYTKAQTDSAIKVAKESIELGVKNTYETKTNVESKISTAVNNIEIGGRNLFLKSDIDKYGIGSWVQNGGTGSVEGVTPDGSKAIKVLGNTGIMYNSWIKLKRNTTYVYSMMMISSGAINIGDSTPLHMWLNTTESSNHLEIITSTSGNISANTWSKVWIVFKTPNTQNTYYMKPFVYGIGSNTVYISKVKVEEGNKVTDWTPAPEDIDSAINSKANASDVYKKSETYTKNETDSKISVAKNDITLSVSNTYETKTNVTSKVNTAKTEAVNSAVNTSKSYADTKKTEAINSANANTTEKLKSYSTTAQMNSAIQVAKDSITNTVSSTYLSKGDATNTYATKSSLTQTANNIEAKFTSSGGYNLIRNSGFKNGITHWSIHQHNSPTASYGFLESTAEWGFPDSTVRTCQIRYSNQTGKEYGLAQSIATTIGKKYTISVYCASHRLNNANIIVRNTNGSWLANKYFNPESYRGGKTSVSNWGKFTLTFTANATSHTINIVAVNGQNDGYFWIAMPQVTEGEVALPYSQHSQEIYSGSTVIDANGVTINNGALTVKNKSGTPVLRGDSNGNLLYTGALYSQIDSSHYAKLEPILTNNNKDVKLRLSLVGSTEHSNFDVVNASGTSLFKVGHGGVEIHKYLTLDTDQTGTYNTKCYWENGTYRPAVANKALVGTNTYYFNSVFSRYFGRDRISGSYTTLQAGAVNFRTAYSGEGCYFDEGGYFRPAVQGAWANGHPSYRWSTVYSVNGVNASSDLRLKENVEYIQETNDVAPLSFKENRVTQQDMYEFVRDDFKLASYNYKGEKFYGDELSYNLGFIAQDLKDSAVGKQFIIPPQEEEGTYSYNMGSYIGVLAGALRIAINKIELLENKIKMLESKGGE